MSTIDLFLRPLPCHDGKWLRADLNSDLRSVEDLALLWNTLIQDCELVSSPLPPVVNTAGNLSYLGDDAKHYCGTELLDCGCCTGYCGPQSSCNCSSCHLLDSDGVVKRTQNSTQNNNSHVPSNEILESWLWGPVQAAEQKSACLNALLAELRDISLQAAGSCLFSNHLRQQLYVYERYFIALSRCKSLVMQKKATVSEVPKNEKTFSKYKANDTFTTNLTKSSENATLGLARVGTRAALNFSFAFLRRAWRSGEDTELCSELLTEALEALQVLPEASLFDTSQVSQLWIEVLERSIKFLRQVVLGDVMGGRCTVPRDDRHTALSLLLELESQKGTLGASLEGVVLLLMLWQKETNTDDNRALPNNNGAPLAPILKRYARISNFGIASQSDNFSPSATENFLRFLTLPDQDTSDVDLKQAAVVIVSHLDRLAKPHIPVNSITNASLSAQQGIIPEQRQEQYVFAFGWTSLNTDMYTLTNGLSTSCPLQPIFAPTLEFSFQIKQIAFTEEVILILSQAGNVFYVKVNKPDSDPIQVDDFGGSHITKIAAHSAARHFLALDFDAQLFHCDNGDNGRLVHSDGVFRTFPSKLNALNDKGVCNVYCGRNCNAAVTTNGEVYTWGRDVYSRLSHDNPDDKLTPSLLQSLKPYKIVDVALGTVDSHSLALSNEGAVFIWGNGNGTHPPVQIQSLPRIQRVFAGPQFNVALSSDGAVYTWGMTNGGQLGQGFQDKGGQEVLDIIDSPKLVSALKGVIIIDVAVGTAHCLALSNTGEVFGWGRNDNQQICPQSVSKDPIIAVPISVSPATVRISGIACGLVHSIVWCQRSVIGIGTRVPFVVDLTEHTFRLLDQLLGMVCTQEGRQTPSQESECIAVACLNLLRLQLHALIANNYSAKNVGLGEGSRLLASLKTRILNLAEGTCVLKTIQEAAQWALQIGWSILLPTASERAKTLTSLLPSEPGVSTSGHRFMTDLLVGSLMAEGGLEIALNQAINSESDDCPNNGHNLPLLHLIKQLLRNNTALTQARMSQLLTDVTHLKANDENLLTSNVQTSPSLDLLHKFQRLLLSHIHQAKNDDVSGAEALLIKYIQHAVSLCITSLQKALEVALQGRTGVTDILSSDISDTLLYELLIGLVLLHRDRPTLLSGFDWMKNFVPLLHSLDNLNRVICNSDIQDFDDMGWPGIICRGNQKMSSLQDEVPLIRKSDFENHIIDGGKWIIYNGYVYDVQNYRSENQATNDLLQNGIGKDLTLELNVQVHRQALEYITVHLKIGKYGPTSCEEKATIHQNRALSHLSSERTLAYLLGLRAGILLNGLPLQPAEIQCKKLLKSYILSGGLQTLQPTNPFDEEKSEARSSASTAGSTPTESSNQIPTCDVPQQTPWPHTIMSHRVECFLNALGEAKLMDPLVITWMGISERFCKENNFVWHQDFSPEHPIQEFERLLTAVLIRHQSLGVLVLSVIDNELSGVSEKLPRQFIEIIRTVYQTKWNLIKMRQQLNRSYKEVCAPLLERLRFLLFEVRPVISLEQSGLRRLSILHKSPRFKSVVKKIIIEMRIAKKQLACAKPEDILNVTIQSQHSAQKNLSQENLCRNASIENLSVKNMIPNLTSLSSPNNSERCNMSNENLELSNNDRNLITEKMTSAGRNSPHNQEKRITSNTNRIDLSSGDSNFITEKISPTGDRVKTPTNSLDFTEKHKEAEQFINDVVLKLNEKRMYNCDYKETNVTIMTQIIDFVMQEVCDVETLRRAMYCQVQRYQVRKQGLEMFAELLKINGLLDAVKYNMLNGYLGLTTSRNKPSSRNILDDLNMITAFQKANIILLHSKILEWGITELQRLVNQETISVKQKFHGGKDNSNLGTYVFLKRSPRARFLLSVFGILARNLGRNELNLIINSGILGTILGLLRQIGGDIMSTKFGNELCVVYEDTILKQKSHRANLTGPELAKLMKIGTRICRGADWKWGEQDGTPPGEGRIISEVGDDGWVRVEWDTGATNSYRMGKEGQYDLRLADSASNVASPDVESNKEDVMGDTQLTGESHPSKLLRHACTKMLQLIAVGTGIHGDDMDKSAVSGIISMFRAIISNKMGLISIGIPDSWTTIGFLRAVVGNSKIMSKLLTSDIWINMYIDMLDGPIASEQDVYKKVHCLKLLQTVLVNWDDVDSTRCSDLTKQLFQLLGKICLYCPNDLSLRQSSVNLKPRVLLSASHSGTVTEEIIALLRKIHTLPVWNLIINSFISQKLCVAADLLGECNLDVNNLENERVFAIGVLNTIGGCDPRPRIGLQVTHDAIDAFICGFTQKGKCQLSTQQEFTNPDQTRISIQTASSCAEHSIFSLSKVPMNEMLLNSWAVLLYGPGERRESIPGAIDVSLLRSQQIQFAVLNANTVLYRKQDLLRNILRQRSPCLPHYSSDESLTDDENQMNMGAREETKNSSDNLSTPTMEGRKQSDKITSENELLVQSILLRATQPSPLKASYTYQELSLASLNVSQMLASHLNSDENAAASSVRCVPHPSQPTLVHGVPVYNNSFNEGSITPSNETSNVQLSRTTVKVKAAPSPLVSQIMEMGFSRKTVEAAIKAITQQTESFTTADQIVQWILEHPDSCSALPATPGSRSMDFSTESGQEEAKSVIDQDSDVDSNDSNDTVEGSSLQDQSQSGVKFATRSNFSSADQYAMYVRGLVCPGMTVRCCQDFEEIKKGDVGTVLKVDTEGLHDLNVHVDWQMHGSAYWVCFIHIEMLEPPKGRSCAEKLPVSVGSQVRLKAQAEVSRNRRPSIKTNIGIVTSVNNKEVTVDFPHQKNWTGPVNDVEVVSDGLVQPSTNIAPPDGDLVDDWSQCIRSLTVSSNEVMARNLLDRNSNYWQSANTQGKPWIRLEIHDNILIHNLSMTVNPTDCSHMPSLVIIRVGDSLETLNDYKWVSVKLTDVNVPLLNDVPNYYQYVEIVIKHCRNNGIQCKVHGINVVGRRKQTDLDLMLQNASFLASEYNNLCDASSTTACVYPEDKSQVETHCTVLVWGLNDKEQLGGLKGSKVKLPTFSQNLSQLQPIHIAGGSKSLFIVSQNGKVYACGEGTNGRLGLGHNCNVSTPRQIPVINQYVIKKVAVHSGGKHALALSLDGKVFSWGEGEDGKLGHGNRLTLDKPKLIEALRSKRIRDIACGSSHSAAITSLGELYTWGLGEYGRLGHGDNCTQLKPKLVTALLGKRVIQVACGSRDAQTLALTEDGIVYSWGDGDFGKLGRGGSEGSSVPHEIDRLTGVGVLQIECGAQFSLALTKSGEVWTWGKGDYYRLGHGSDQHVRKPAVIQGLRGKKVIHVAVGALHCLAVTDTGQVYAWGDNDHGQQGSGTTIVNKKPVKVVGLDSIHVNRVACGSSHSVAWSLPQSPIDDDKVGPVPFSTTKDPLGGSSLGIYDSEPQPNPTSTKSTTKTSLSETLLSLETYGARQTSLNYVLNAMSILQARQLIVAALTSHTQMNGSDKAANESESQNLLKDIGGSSMDSGNEDVIVHGGGEGPADASELAVHEQSPEAEPVSTHVAPLNAFQSLTGSLSLSASISSCNAAHRHSRMSASAMSVMAATMTNQEEITAETSITGLDDFTSLLGEMEAKSLVELLKLSVAGRTGPASTAQTIANTLIALGSNSPTIGAMILETCITELEDLCTSRHYLRKMPKFVVQETSHPYIDDVTLVGHVKIPGAEALRLEFDSQCSTEKRNDPLIIMDGSGRVIAARSGRELVHWAPEIRIPGDEMRWKFTSDSSVNGWGWRFWVHAIMPASFMQELGSDRAVLSQPSMPLVIALLHSRLVPNNQSVLLRLASALSACAQLPSLTTTQRIWSLKKLHSILTSKNAPRPLDPSFNNILMPLMPELLRQYEYEEPQVRGGIHLMHSEYFKTLTALACDMQLDSTIPVGEMHKWSWFRRYCSAVRVAQALIHRKDLPRPFCIEVMKKLSEMISSTSGNVGAITAPSTSLTTSLYGLTPSTTPPPPSTSTNSFQSSQSSSSSSNANNNSIVHYVDSILRTQETKARPTEPAPLLLHEDHNVFKAEHDRQLLQWLNRRPEDWALSWGGASTIYGWGHNHRGQLGGLEGSRVKIPTPCEALSLLRPIQLAGGEQTLYAVTPDGKLFATGYGAGGRLGIGGVESVSTPTLVESLQHVFIKKVAVNSGGKHCLALTTDGEVYSWGEGEDGKLGHGNRISVDRPKLIEALSGMGIVDIACGSAHSACITSTGHILTWGKGRYGRLGHGDSEDQLRPKLVETLLGCRAIDIACGSGDAQTLCITDDDNVWSWGDGDYGKLGRGGSDGCKIPMKIESLAGLGVIKVECGSQFSVALTRSGAVYTWGKGDYHRLGHGTPDHVRRPKKVAALYGKKIISIATGSLHCVACSDTGEVYTWGDNDEGQLGDGTVSAIQRPRLVAALQGKHIVKVTCGSAHTLALSTSQLTQGARPLPSPPLEYDLVRDLPPAALHARLVLLYHFSELLCPCLAMLPISGELSLGSLKDVLVYNIKEAAFRKVIQTTMVRDKQHGPVIELNRIQVKRSRIKSGNGVAGVDGMKSVFGQMVQKLPLLTQEALSLPHRVWKVKFVGESVDDCGGGYSESIAEMCDELQNGSVPLLIPTPNGRGEAGANRDCFLLDPTLISVLQMNMFRFLGVLMGIAVRTGSPLSLNLAEPVWRQLAGESLRLNDLTEVDRDYVAGLLYIRDMADDPKIFSTLELPFSTSSAKGHEVPLSTRYTRITPTNRQEYVRLALNYRLHEFDEQVKAVRDGMSKVIPVPLLSLFSASELQAMVCGSPDIPLNLLKSVATYKGVDPNSSLVQWFWEVMEEFTNQERSLFLRFVWGRTRLPRTIADFRGRDFVLQVLDKYNPPDHFLPESYTCFFLLKMPRYSCKAVLLEKLKYAIHFCKSIDTDEYARVAMGDPAEATGSEDSDLDSVTSHE